ncbi:MULTISPECIES: transporter [unclassified Pseudomonas]|uniref:SphA family protein n=1 Tax=unclassified Pseudomonas TaxID=196821 RepID=UPI00130502F0|nr:MULTISPECIES: transporter [unclassified Pseudomonas]
MNRKYALCVALLAAQGFSSTYINAAENIKPAGPIGGTDIRQAILPPPGVYGVGIGVGLGFPEYWTEDEDLDAKGGSRIFGVGGAIVYDMEVFGGNIASTAFASYERTCFGFKGGKKMCSEGQGDIYSDVLMWSRNFPLGYERSQSAPWIPYGLNVLVGLGVTLPTGKYDSSKMVNVSANVYDFAPNVALTYIVPSIFGDQFGDATEFSARVFYNKYTENHDTDYQTGDLVSMDFAVSQRFGQWQVGLAGTGFVQIEDDDINGFTPPNNGNRAKSLSLGPVVSYDFMWDDNPWNFTFKGLAGIDGENTASARGVVLKLGRKFW